MHDRPAGSYAELQLPPVGTPSYQSRVASANLVGVALDPKIDLEDLRNLARDVPSPISPTVWINGARGWLRSRRKRWKEPAHFSQLEPYQHLIFHSRTKRIVAWIFCLVVIVLIRFKWRSPRVQHHSSAHLSLLTQDVKHSRGECVARALTSQTNPYGYINLIDPYQGEIFNPTVLVLPDTVPVESRILMIARGKEVFEIIENSNTRWESIVACFLLPLRRKHLPLPYLARESDLFRPYLHAERKVPYQRCINPEFDQYIGPEDPRLFFTNDGQPLLIYSQTGRSPMVCRALSIIDARVLVPGLTEALAKGGWKAPVVFGEQTDLIRDEQSNVEKNWAPFLGEGDELFFHVNLVPQEIYKFAHNVTLRNLLPEAPAYNCLSDLSYVVQTWNLRTQQAQHGTFCHNTDKCSIKYHPEPFLHYERRVLTWNITSPYEYLSVSPPLTYVGTNQADPIFTVSMSWNHPTRRKGLGLNHGFLDDILIVSFGVFDYGSAYIDVMAADLMAEHQLCDSVQASLWT